MDCWTLEVLGDSALAEVKDAARPSTAGSRPGTACEPHIGHLLPLFKAINQNEAAPGNRHSRLVSSAATPCHDLVLGGRHQFQPPVRLQEGRSRTTRSLRGLEFVSRHGAFQADGGCPGLQWPCNWKHSICRARNVSDSLALSILP